MKYTSGVLGSSPRGRTLKKIIYLGGSWFESKRADSMQTVVITGISRGIGKALAEKFLREGYAVMGTSSTGISGIKNAHLTVFQLDLSNSKSIEMCTKEISSRGKKIDILINNAGVWSNNENDSALRVELLRKVMEVNLFGTVDFTEHIIPLMNEGGHLLTITSRAGSFSHVHAATYPDYKISKAALNMAVRIWTFRLKGKIIVSAVHPGWVKTDMGGPQADIEPQEAAEDIFKLATSRPETGQFWFKGEKFPW